jgi:uncharacterized membrane protein
VTLTQRNRTRAAAASRLQAPRWAVLGSPLASAAGLGVSIYLSIAHYTTTVTLACPQTATVNCEKVTSSAESTFLGIPVALLGAAYFAVMLVLCLPVAWRVADSGPGRALRWLRAVAALGGIGFVAWLVYAELFVIDAICLWCTTVHALTFILFGIIALGTAAATETVETETV